MKSVQTPTGQVARALMARGYQRLASHLGAANTGVECWEVYSHAESFHVLILQSFRDGGCELFTPLCASGSLDETIAAIP